MSEVVNKEEIKETQEMADEKPMEEQNGESEKLTFRPLKRFFRQRAHCNPLSHNDSFEYPECPSKMDWSPYYPKFFKGGNDEELEKENELHKVSVLDIGCGYGGLTVALSKILPDHLCLGLEIRLKVVEYVHLTIQHLREEYPGEYQNISVLRTNTMKYLMNYIGKGQVDKIFICFPDPQFKEKNHRRRIVSQSLLTEYSYFLKDGGMLYTITDVKELGEWHQHHLQSHPSFTYLQPEEYANDPCAEAIVNSTQEGQKVTRNHGSKYIHIARKKSISEMQTSVFDLP
ncbi:hypothetical protein WA158_005542, partial [Blastocystis sp. Blastoise]